MSENLPQKSHFLVYQADDGTLKIDVRLEDETVWLPQQLMADLFQTTQQNISQHIKAIYEEGELDPAATHKKFLSVRREGSRQVRRELDHYNLDMIISVGYRVKSHVATRFRIWATQRLTEYVIKGFTMDDERLKNPDHPFDYFDELLRRIQDIRTSERRFYQKITDIYATAIDYDRSATATQRFFAMVQNKLHWAIHGQTAAEVIVDRADAGKQHMGLNTWKDAPHGKIQKFDVSVAKNYLTEPEMAQLSRLVNAYLDVAEDMAQRQIPMTMEDWATRLNRFIEATDREILQDAGKVTAEIAKAHAESEFEKYRIVQDRLFVSDFDAEVLGIAKGVEESGNEEGGGK